MADAPNLDDLNLHRMVEANRDYADRRGGGPLAGRPARKLCILTCMDCRIDPMAALGLALGDAHVLRNAGGRITDDAVRSMVLSAYALGAREFGVMHHTRCGLHNAANDAVAAAVAGEGGPDVSHIDFLGFDDLAGSVRDDVHALTRSGLLPQGSVVWGAVFDVDAGTLDVVVPAAALG